MYKFLHERMFSILLDICLRVKLLDHRVILGLTLKGPPDASPMGESLHVLSSDGDGSHVSTSLPTFPFPPHMIAILSGCEMVFHFGFDLQFLNYK